MRLPAARDFWPYFQDGIRRHKSEMATLRPGESWTARSATAARTSSTLAIRRLILGRWAKAHDENSRTAEVYAKAL